MAMVRRWLHDDSYEVQCPTCRQCVPASKAVFDGLEPLPRHSQWTRSVVQDSFAQWPPWLQRRWTLRAMIRLEALARWATRRLEPACMDETPRLYREWLPDGFGQLGPR